MNLLSTHFNNREDCRDYLHAHFTHLSPHDHAISPIQGGHQAAQTALQQIDPIRYGKTRNHLNGAVTRLSPYIRHGILNLADVRYHALTRASPTQAESFIQELTWREYWRRVYGALGNRIWEDQEPYKTGYTAHDYATTLPLDIRNGTTDSPLMNAIIHELLEVGYLHNRLRMYLAAYVVHWRKVQWQAGAAWFLEHLLDGDPASNNLGWQWVASTFASKPYLFNWENVQKFDDGRFDALTPEPAFNQSYETLQRTLFRTGSPIANTPTTSHDRLKRVARPRLAVQPNLKNPIIWVHGDNLHQQSSAFRRYPNAPAIFVFDQPTLNLYDLSLKRVMFLYESLLELPVEIRIGRTVADVLTFAREHQADGIITMTSEAVGFRRRVQKLRAHLPVQVLSDRAIVDDEQAYDLRRFMRFWNQVRGVALNL